MWYVVYYKKVDEIKFHVYGSYDLEKEAQENTEKLYNKGYRVFYKQQWIKPLNK